MCLSSQEWVSPPYETVCTSASTLRFPGVLLCLCHSFLLSFLSATCHIGAPQSQALGPLLQLSTISFGNWPQPLAPVALETPKMPLPTLSCRQLARISHACLPTCPKVSQNPLFLKWTLLQWNVPLFTQLPKLETWEWPITPPNLSPSYSTKHSLTDFTWWEHLESSLFSYLH